MALEKFDKDGNRIASYGTNTFKYLKYLGGGYFLARRNPGSQKKIDLCKFTPSGYSIVRTLKTYTRLQIGQVIGGITSNRKTYALRERRQIGFPPFVTTRYYIRTYDKNWKQIRAVLFTSVAGYLLNEVSCVDFDGMYYYSGAANGLWILTQDTMKIVRTLTLNLSGYIPIDIAITPLHIWVTYEQSGGISERIAKWTKSGSLIKYFNVTPTGSQSLMTDGKYLYK